MRFDAPDSFTYYFIMLDARIINSQSQFSPWVEARMRAGESVEAIVEDVLSSAGPMRFYRASTILLQKEQLTPSEIERIFDLLARSRDEGDRQIQILVEITHSHIRLSPLDGTWPPNRAEVLAVKPVLDKLNREVRDLGAGIYKREIEWRLNFCLLACAFAFDDNDSLDEYSANILSLAKIWNEPYFINRALQERASVLYRLRRYSESAQMYTALIRKNDAILNLYSDLSVVRKLLAALVNLGGLSATNDVIQSFGIESLDSYIIGMRRFSKMIAGELADVDESIWLYEKSDLMLSLSLKADQKFATPRINSERNKFLNQILDSSPGEIFTTDDVFTKWMRSRSRLCLKEIGLAIGEIRELPPIDSEDLLNRLLVSGLRIELSMNNIGLPKGEFLLAIQEMRSVFSQARKLDHAEPKSLMQVLLRWHPHAAVYCAIMSDPIPELLPAIDNVVRVGERVTWRTKVIPSDLLPFLIRQGLALKALPPRLSGNALAQVNRLRDDRYDMAIWGPVVTVPPIALAFLKVGDHETALRVLSDFGADRVFKGDLQLSGLIDDMAKVASGNMQLSELLQQMIDLQ